MNSIQILLLNYGRDGHIDDQGVFRPSSWVLRNRPTKTAKGMTKTFYRSGHNVTNEACTLSVKGTLDRLRSNWMFITSDRTTGKKVLTDSGRRKLARLRRKRAQ